ncbi:hypothetical protein EDD17DRAFT_870357 [Pisolithus thermaeus]|nr:hypothetical protein EV401DRAFT_127120 [Pisolithus croceorrhizus]KAI6159951.1 hypothetical protein EDD17DRAFT_870357 [Pisolithus thermaeus]
MLQLMLRSPFSMASRNRTAPLVVYGGTRRHLRLSTSLYRNSLSHAPGGSSSPPAKSSNIFSSSAPSTTSDRLAPDTELSPHPNTEDYVKDDVDTSPPSSSVYAIDPSCENVQPAQDAPTSGQWSQASAHSGEWSQTRDSAQTTHSNGKTRWEDQYENVSRDEPYDVPSPSKETWSLKDGSPGEERKLRYGGRETRTKEKNDVSPPSEGPTGTEKGGRKPEGK